LKRGNSVKILFVGLNLNVFIQQKSARKIDVERTML